MLILLAFSTCGSSPGLSIAQIFRFNVCSSAEETLRNVLLCRLSGTEARFKGAAALALCVKVDGFTSLKSDIGV